MRANWISAAGLTAALAAPAWAEQIFADQGTFLSITPGAVIPPDNIVDNLNMGPIDGAGAAYTDNTGAGAVTILFSAHFPTVYANDVSAPIYLYLNDVSAGVVTLTSARWQTGNFTTSNAGDHFATLNAFAPITLVAGSYLVLPGSGDSSNYTQNVGGDTFANRQYDTVLFTFVMSTSGGGQTISIDAVANPEPGTMALFGLGALGLGGLAWRRRARRLAVAKA